jgi:hypothetical protein
MKKKVFLLIGLLLGILFPFAALTQFSNAYATAFNFVFDSLLSHILMHAALFAALSWIMMCIFSKKSIMTRFLICMGSVLIVAFAQETVQMISTNTSDIGAALFDLGIDLSGGLIPLIIQAITNRYKKVEHI